MSQAGANVAIIICNWNKREYVLKCIESVLRSSYTHYDLYVVDNGSTDGSADAITAQFASQVKLIRKSQNTGGAGGFQVGIQAALAENYEFLYLLDNDVVVDQDALRHLVEFLSSNPEIGAAGSKILYMDKPDTIQYLGASIDWDHFCLTHHYKNQLDTNDLPSIIDTDMIPACSMLVKTKAIVEVGGMDSEYFIYFDDVDMCYAMKLRGYKLSIYIPSIVWHKRSALVRNSTFEDYYIRRNSNYFFLKYMSPEKVPVLAERFVDIMFKEFYLGTYNSKYDIVRTRLFALEDLLNGTRGKAMEGRVVTLPTYENRLFEIIKSVTRIAILDDGTSHIKKIYNQIVLLKPDVEITIILSKLSRETVANLFQELPLITDQKSYDKTNFELTIQICEHVSLFPNYVQNKADLYVDLYSNVIYGKEDERYISNYDTVFKAYKELHLPLIIQRLYECKKNIQSLKMLGNG
ncbi:glycosyltransferase family 2 protein [Paenibacillus sp. PAMC21692]|uniref:glycosyltransferase family 2 protein n=1 Tax=Paenibacillus sp. PAMC21692 TaxID=2762320 RepID=UPI00164EACE2|nr:glycosyltransferase family 2 protein [Paenibacillus sp. PAMC21692]QNK58371.1 glycosyltransferase family 2 protein [Paenibacillus sp. PAMC21692]